MIPNPVVPAVRVRGLACCAQHTDPDILQQDINEKSQGYDFIVRISGVGDCASRGLVLQAVAGALTWSNVGIKILRLARYVVQIAQYLAQKCRKVAA
jgi:hypothetical protein